MKGKLCISLLSLSLGFLIVFFACSKAKNSSQPDPSDPNNDTSKVGIKNTTGCTAGPDYGDSIIYTKYKGPNNDFTIKPKNDTVGGRYIFWPDGLVLDSTSGEINVTQSETGVRYNIGFIKTGTQDTCVSRLILAGITFVDSIYVLDNNDTLATPVFNANPQTPPVCDNSDDNDYPGNGNHGNNKCEFDVEPNTQHANDNKVRVRTMSGVINLKKTLADGAFGTNPQNGSTVKVPVYYRLNDNSGKALQKINLQLVYYENLSDVPTSLRNEITVKRRNFLDFRIVNGKPRPPLLVIVLHY